MLDHSHELARGPGGLQLAQLSLRAHCGDDVQEHAAKAAAQPLRKLGGGGSETAPLRRQQPEHRTDEWVRHKLRIDPSKGLEAAAAVLQSANARLHHLGETQGGCVDDGAEQGALAWKETVEGRCGDPRITSDSLHAGCGVSILQEPTLSGKQHISTLLVGGAGVLLDHNLSPMRLTLFRPLVQRGSVSFPSATGKGKATPRS